MFWSVSIWFLFQARRCVQLQTIFLFHMKLVCYLIWTYYSCNEVDIGSRIIVHDATQLTVSFPTSASAYFRHTTHYGVIFNDYFALALDKCRFMKYFHAPVLMAKHFVLLNGLSIAVKHLRTFARCPNIFQHCILNATFLSFTRVTRTRYCEEHEKKQDKFLSSDYRRKLYAFFRILRLLYPSFSSQVMLFIRCLYM